MVSTMEATVPCLEAGRVGKEAGRKVAQLVLVEAEGAEDPEAGQGPRMDGGQLVVGQQEGVKVGQLGQRVPAHNGQSESTHLQAWHMRRKMRLNAKYYHLKINLLKDFAAGVYLSEVQNPPPHTMYTCKQYTCSQREGGEGGELYQREG